MRDLPKVSSADRPLVDSIGENSNRRNHLRLNVSTAHFDGDSPSLTTSSSAEADDRSPVECDPYRSELNSYDERRYQQYWRLAAAEELEEMSDHSLVPIGPLDGFYDAPEEVHGYDGTPDSGIHDFSTLDPEQRARYEEEWKLELSKIEDEIMTLRQVLSAKMGQSQELKRKLGITAWKEFRDDMEQGIKNIQESTAYQKTSQTLRVAGEKTTTALGTIGASVSKKLGEVKNSTAFKSFEEKVGTAYTSVKTKVSNSRSNSVNSFEDSLNNLDGRSSNVATPITSPTIPEGKPLV